MQIYPFHGHHLVLVRNVNSELGVPGYKIFEKIHLNARKPKNIKCTVATFCIEVPQFSFVPLLTVWFSHPPVPPGYLRISPSSASSDRQDSFSWKRSQKHYD